MFKFDFEIEDAEEQAERTQDSTIPGRDEAIDAPRPARESTEHSLPDLLSNGPPSISFSPLNIRTNAHDSLTLARRDLFDARFQLIASEPDDMADDGTQSSTENALEFLDAPSDLVPGIYEGGLKTWECSIDLAECLHQTLGDAPGSRLHGKKILELGCGTAVPSLYAMHQLFSVTPSANSIHENVVVLQDYNELVLRLVTLPNAILTWYMSPASHPFRASYQPSTDDPEVEEEPLPPADSTQPGTLPFSQALITAFLASLKEYRIALRFFSGSWEAFDIARAGGPFDIVLTSETIYRPESLPALVRVMRSACVPADGLAEGTARMTIRDTLGEDGRAPYLCLVAAKRVYFGVGGGVAEFVKAVEEHSVEEGASAPSPQQSSPSSKVETVWERTEGVKRIVMRVFWGQS
ncbi:uncharacterized protein C8Q71DRAFT_119473 [Rhodofomes roseus]|uniref:protein-histidine N-methyltransferase n=1 Tax=Rhodofomes roseus TaxID=34475 RepID=A0ABQ8KDT2_9APHY|nr:uncharacterized protein C8Q71DRAFT_119473 [Rhodofomes roseus]KAH9835427.1 hypothetical protein C8Q71DRAFT_119473 [Rhodofomes roseus]